MPNLPTFTVTQATAQRLLDAFDGHTDEDGSPLTPQQAYKQWLKRNLVAFVSDYETEHVENELRGEITG